MEINFRDIVLDGVERIELARDRCNWQGVVNIVINPRVS